jgi:hypothetical protein
MREINEGISGAEPVYGVERRRFAAEDDDVVCLAVMLFARERNGIGVCHNINRNDDFACII